GVAVQARQRGGRREAPLAGEGRREAEAEDRRPGFAADVEGLDAVGGAGAGVRERGGGDGVERVAARRRRQHLEVERLVNAHRRRPFGVSAQPVDGERALPTGRLGRAVRGEEAGYGQRGEGRGVRVLEG